jgi:hypothetical protein
LRKVKEVRIDRDAKIDAILDGKKETVSGTAKLIHVNHLVWEIDKIPGKRGILIEIEAPEKRLTVNFTPSSDFCEKLVDWMLECEWLNDNFKFPADMKRPPQLRTKIDRIQEILDKWRSKTETSEKKKWHLHTILKRD